MKTTMETKTGSDVARLHKLLWEAADDVPELEKALEKARTDRIERRVEEALSDTGTLQTTEATKEPEEVATLEAALEETKAVVVALAKRHREAVGAALSAELAEKEKARTANWERKSTLESKQAQLFAQLNRLQSEINGLDLAPARVRNLRECAVSGLAHELRDVARNDPDCTILPTELEKALVLAAEIARARGKTVHATRHDVVLVPGRVAVRYDGTSGLLDPHAPGSTVAVESLLGRLPDGSFTDWEPVSDHHTAFSTSRHVAAPPVPSVPDPLKVARR